MGDIQWEDQQKSVNPWEFENFGPILHAKYTFQYIFSET